MTTKSHLISDKACLMLSRLFGRAIHALSRISDEVWFDPIEKGLALRSVNSSRSAYACVFFSSMYFQQYNQAAIHEQGQGDVRLHFKCKFAIKSVMPVFRCLNTLERNVEKCNVHIDFKDCHMVFQLFCKHGITKTHNLTFQECEPLQAVFAKHMCPNILKIQSRVLSDIMIHFPTHQEEITLAVNPLKVCFKSYVEEVMGCSKAVRTELHLSPDEFDYFQVGLDSEVTFCLKELRGFLTFAEATSAYISIHFGQSGKPVAFSVEDIVFEANIVLATLADTDTGAVSQRSQLISHSFTQERANAAKEVAIEETDKENYTESMTTNKYLSWNKRRNCNKSANDIGSTLLQKSVPNNKGVSDEDNDLMEEVIPRTPTYKNNYQEQHSLPTEQAQQTARQFSTLFFGAVSSDQQEDFNLTSYSLATASDSEEDLNNGQKSQTF
ncbi:cell cycle checkpoint control protein RAD9B [Ambystoma mexicanum]|uniref:cell cycle checkpoint control protein RAD9B n=1 Tax=Ambystoma mexicanum TaxID=8296 RepID=UPI0037E7EDA6